MFFPAGRAASPPFSFRWRSRHGPSGPRRECGVDAGSPCVGRPESIQSKGAPTALCAVGEQRERAAGAVQERTRQGDNRGISAEMQCGTASRAARDLTGEPCSPVNPFFLDGGFWLGEGASRELSGGVGGAFWLPEEQKASKPPTIFLWYRQAAPSLRRSRHGVIERRAASAASDAGSPCVGRPESIQSKGPPLRPALWGIKKRWRGRPSPTRSVGYSRPAPVARNPQRLEALF